MDFTEGPHSWFGLEHIFPVQFLKWYSEWFSRVLIKYVHNQDLILFSPHAFPSWQKPGMDLADTYIMFVRQNQDILREKVNEEMYIEKLFDVSSYSARCAGMLGTAEEEVTFWWVRTADSPLLILSLLCSHESW